MDEMAYEVVRSDRKTLCLEVLPDGRVRVRAPRAATGRAIAAFVESRREWLKGARMRVLEHAAVMPDENEMNELCRQAERVLPMRVAHFARLMDVAPTAVRIGRARGRLGSCSASGRLCFSGLVMRLSPDVIDYVIVHELAHLTHLNHSPAFHALVRRFLPNADALRQRAKRLSP